MQSAKDTFYVTLRDRLAVVNASRTVTLRSVVRPGIVVEENELPGVMDLPDVFVLRWTAIGPTNEGVVDPYVLRCEIGYATVGDADGGGMDRGRTLSAMDAELMAMLLPGWAMKKDFSVSPAAKMGTRIFWGTPLFAVAKESPDALMSRMVTVDVYGYMEAGER